MKGKKLGPTIVLEREPPVPDGAEVEVLVPGEWQAQREFLLSIGVHPDFGSDLETEQKQWTPVRF